MKPRLHLLGLPHTITSNTFSHCAFTGKVKRFAPMMRSVGYEVVHYGIEGADSGANKDVVVLTQEQWNVLRALSRQEKGLPPETETSFTGELADTDTSLYRVFNDELRSLLRSHVQSERDIICLPFGHAHDLALGDVPRHTKIETGIGYPTTCSRFRVFESSAWMHWHFGKEQSSGQDYSWVIPNYYDLSEWSLGKGTGDEHGPFVLYFGRICQIKGLGILYEIAKRRPNIRFVLCGQGDAAPWADLPNVEVRAPVSGLARSKLLGQATCLIAPSVFIEPFGGVVVEAALSGTPSITSDHGAFLETVHQGATGYRCKTLGDYLAALDEIKNINRAFTRGMAAAKYDMLKLAHLYERVFTQVDDLWGPENGWYTQRSPLFECVLKSQQERFPTPKKADSSETLEVAD